MNKFLLGVTIAALGIGLTLPFPEPSAAGVDSGTSTGSASPATVTSQVYAPPALGKGSPPPVSADFDDQVNRWIAAISREPGFEAWQRTSWERYPLGPGTHSWVVHLRQDGLDVGYLVVTSAPDGSVQLSEYGLGEHPLFSWSTLHQSMMRQGLIPTLKEDSFISQYSGAIQRHYIDALHAFWRVELGQTVYYFDGKTAEWLPLDDGLMKDLPARPNPGSSGASPAQIGQRMSLEPFDPFYRVNWLTRKPMAVEDAQALQLGLHHEAQMTYVAHLFNRSMLCAYAVTGFQEWNDSLSYIRLDVDGARFVPYELLSRYGSFYQ